MTYRVEYMPKVIAAVDCQVQFLREQGAGDDRITGWLTRLFDLTDGLYQFPRRYVIAEEESAVTGLEIRRLVFGDYLIFYHVDDEAGRVLVVHFRHGAQATSYLIIEDETKG